ncbi:MAG: hypothetical protein KGN84_19735 [Acidobacteriota bacterium]|nr:hypothetical protein [Acidobacteriota bacterium]
MPDEAFLYLAGRDETAFMTLFEQYRERSLVIHSAQSDVMHKSVHTLAGLLLASAVMPAQKPSAADAAALIEKSREKSLAYTRSLPDFVCTELISRYRRSGSSPGGTLETVAAADVLVTASAVPTAPDWFRIDKLTVNLSYFQQHEAHKLKLLNGKPTQQTFDSLGVGVTSTGEFGNILGSIFDPNSQTSFRWESWKNVRHRPVGVYVYQVEESHSSYRAMGGKAGDLHQDVVGFHGTLEIDRETGGVMHLVLVADHIPSELQISRTTTEIDYDFMGVAGSRYLLPMRSQTKLDSKIESLKNESEFRDYRKFDVGSKVNFDMDK